MTRFGAKNDKLAT